MYAHTSSSISSVFDVRTPCRRSWYTMSVSRSSSEPRARTAMVTVGSFGIVLGLSSGGTGVVVCPRERAVRRRVDFGEDSAGGGADRGCRGSGTWRRGRVRNVSRSSGIGCHSDQLSYPLRHSPQLCLCGRRPGAGAGGGQQCASCLASWVEIGRASCRERV